MVAKFSVLSAFDIKEEEVEIPEEITSDTKDKYFRAWIELYGKSINICGDKKSSLEYANKYAYSHMKKHY